ncbi:MAG TPA: TIGR00725 family protein [Leptolyngbyaceae cyanobacterium M65_K2018_010]|nr:TIGR00725 family protein [Leptolyngbyaceae cyanobacterium M65_K2018_010]
MAKVIIGVMGPGEQATPEQAATAYELGQAIAQAGWVLLTGGRNVGVMEAASQGARAEGGLTVGILPGRDASQMSAAVDIPIFTGIGDARNGINVLSSRVVVICGAGLGTAAETALALKAQRPVIFLQPEAQALRFWQSLVATPLTAVPTVTAAIAKINQWLSDAEG